MERSRLLVLGLDGVALDTARALAPHCPNLTRIAERAATVRSELPELSPVNWTSLFTGEGPEVHGVYGFTAMDPASYQLRVVNAESVRCPTIFDRLGERGIVSRVVNLPGTYPARPLRGMMISGFVAEDLARAVFPPFLASALGDYVLEADTTRGASDPAYLLAQLRATLASRRRALELLWPDLDWDLFVFVLTETDRLFHFLHPAITRDEHPLRADVLALLRDWDTLIGEVLARFEALPEPKRLMVVADHGFCDLKTEVDLNAWLMERGLLNLSGTPADEWDASHIAPSSVAFAMDPGRIVLHARDRFPHARLSRLECGARIPELLDGLAGLTWRGERVMNEVLPVEQAYGGDPAPGAPDILCVPNAGFDLKAKFDRTEAFGLHGRFGTHTADGAIWYDSRGERPWRMRETGQLILKHFEEIT